MQVGFVFTPSSTGDKESIIGFHCNDSVNSIVSVSLEGCGVEEEYIPMDWIYVMYEVELWWNPWPPDPWRRTLWDGLIVIPDWLNGPFQTSLLGYDYDYTRSVLANGSYSTPALGSVCSSPQAFMPYTGTNYLNFQFSNDWTIPNGFENQYLYF